MLSENTHQQEQHQQATMSNKADPNGKDKMIFGNSKDGILFMVYFIQLIIRHFKSSWLARRRR